MTYSPLQIEIIKTFGSKELSEGCIVKYKGVYEKVVFYNLEEERLLLDLGQYEADRQDIEIIGHIPHLFPDVARVAKEKGWLFSYQSEKLTFYGLPGPHFIPYKSELSLIDQEEATIVQLLNLFK